jgi:3-methyladenine DNA glycosylase AlkC
LKNLSALQSKKAQIDTMVSDLEANRKVYKRKGGYTIEDAAEEVNFQQERAAVLQWAEDKDEEDIIAEIQALEAQLSPAELNCKYGIVRGLSLETILLISKIELLELSIDEHGKHKGGWN